ncbi:unnamed protein product, partial [Brassica rapa subsp. trilocularis]
MGAEWIFVIMIGLEEGGIIRKNWNQGFSKEKMALTGFKQRGGFNGLRFSHDLKRRCGSRSINYEICEVFGELKMDHGRSVQMGSLVSSNRRLPYQVLVGIGMGVKQWVIGYKGFSGLGYGAQ